MHSKKSTDLEEAFGDHRGQGRRYWTSEVRRVLHCLYWKSRNPKQHIGCTSIFFSPRRRFLGESTMVVWVWESFWPPVTPPQACESFFPPRLAFNTWFSAFTSRCNPSEGKDRNQSPSFDFSSSQFSSACTTTKYYVKQGVVAGEVRLALASGTICPRLLHCPCATCTCRELASNNRVIKDWGML